MSRTPPAHSRIAVIGAGIAGLACASDLASTGVEVHVFEKSRGVSGRMGTRRGEGWQCDHGAQYFTARDLDFRAEVQRWISAGAAALWTPRLRVYDQATSAGWQSAGSSIERFVGTPGMTAPGRLLAQSLTVHTEVHVSALQRRDSRWQLQAQCGPVPGDFAAVLLAIPAPQAQILLAQVAPALATQAGEVRMRPSWALMLHFDQAPDLPFDAAFVNAGPLRWIARDSSKPSRIGSELWLLHATAAWSIETLDWMPEQVAAHMLEAFLAMGGVMPTRWVLHCWRYADSEQKLEVSCLWNATSGLGLCGDWLQEGKVEGAWLSGRALAMRVLAVVGVQAGESRQCRRLDFASPNYQHSLSLREAVLRAPLGLTLSPQDLQGEETQWHFGLYDARDNLLACVVAVPRGSGEFKLRQMAVRADLQGQGCGVQLLAAVEEQLQAQGARLILLHARVSATAFYQKQGYVAQGEDFEEVGMAHRKMRKSLQSA